MPKRILYICTHNRCRSIIAEAITRHLAGNQITASSAGSEASGYVHPMTLQYLSQENIPTQDLRSQSWDNFADFDPHVIVTMCDTAVGETCPAWFESYNIVHWGLPDPTGIGGNQDKIQDAFLTTIGEITKRINLLLEHDLEHLDNNQLAEVLVAVAA